MKNKDKDKDEVKINPNFQDLYIRSVMETDRQLGTELLKLNRPEVFKMLFDINHPENK